MKKLLYFLTPFFWMPALSAQVLINEIHYNSEPNTARDEFVELYNAGTEVVDVSGWFFQDGISFTIPGSTEIGVGEYLVIAQNPGQMSAVHGVTALGPFGGGLSGKGERVELRNAAGIVVDVVNYQASFPWPVGAGGTGSSMELVHPSLDNDLGGSWRSSNGSAPTPKAVNSVFSTVVPPQIRQVEHTPKEPNDTEKTVITAKVTDGQGVGSVELFIQIVSPGSYVPAYLAKSTSLLLSNPNGERTPNPDYFDAGGWMTIGMVDDGSGDDALAGDGVYTATVAPQGNRTLVRYRVVATDTGGASIEVPYADDDSLNFAYFVYNGVPDFVASTRSINGTGHVYPAATVGSVPVYHVLTTAADFNQAVAYQGSNQIPRDNYDARSAYNWSCTFVYEGKVYDHTQYRLRQRNARYSGSGKRSLKFRFQRGNYPTFRDSNGDKYPEPWKYLATHKMIGSRGHYTWGMDQSVNHTLWNLTGTPAPNTHWFNLRVIRGEDEAPDQYGGDHYGMLLALEEYDKRFLDAHNLEKGNLYKLISGRTDGVSVRRYQAPDAVDDGSDFQNIIFGLRPEKDDAWLRENVNYDSWYHYHSVVDMIRHYDVDPNTAEHLKNRAYYFEPSATNPLGRLNVLPWDSDTSWGPNWNAGIDWAKAAIYGTTGNSPREPFNTEYLNVVREMRDLIWTPEQVSLLIDPLAAKIDQVIDLDRDRWRSATGGSQSDPPLEDVTVDMKKFAFDGGSWVGGSDTRMPLISRDTGVSGQEGRDAYLDALVADPAIPNKPTIAYSGVDGFPQDGVALTSSAFSDPQGAGTFGAMEWRLAEVSVPDGGEEVIMPMASVWRYLDDGSDQGTAWKEQGFNDSSWGQGLSPLGYGGVSGLDIETTVGYGGSTFNRNATTYFRTQVTVEDPSKMEKFIFSLLVDDGAIVYVNGEQVIREGFHAETVVAYDVRADFPGGESTFDEFEVSPSVFVPGVNDIAIEVHQQTASSSDMGFEMTILGKRHLLPVGQDPVFEWSSIWESGELGSFVSSVDVPAVTKVGQTYRARVRHQDMTGRWSNWSDPLEFVAGVPTIQPLLDGLVISEIMYEPNPPSVDELAVDPTLEESDFEWIEIMNAGSVALDLSEVRFTKGIEFDFVNAARTMIEPGERMVVVGKESAFNLRYGFVTTPSFVVGTFDKNLANNGERVKLSFGAGTAIRDFEYKTGLPWPLIANGGNRSLVYIAVPGSLLDPTQGTSWRAGITEGGAPGLGESLMFTGDPTGDDDGDGIPNLVDYAAPDGLMLELMEGGFAELSYRRVLAADDVELLIEEDMEDWKRLGGAYELVDETFYADGTSRPVYRSVEPVSGRDFYRIRAVLRGGNP
ncbi:MAG: lamin tail domain-containing protein [Verrucomicrobiaceae bacterium]